MHELTIQILLEGLRRQAGESGCLVDQAWQRDVFWRCYKYGEHHCDVDRHHDLMQAR